ncbi:MAG: hypothetical protein HON47_00465 [Candidatus Diapherotrites archaeon]|jgi:hypothetical protein|uniref:Uncharacterized protein n=1 Tax=Candidatus Iainarchaeum sp. TaxID=3101447 RepID=A0A8T5GDD2_9ARCH|nr:hypothetical protein [Candidatus Diapherotrites archaeon]
MKLDNRLAIIIITIIISIFYLVNLPLYVINPIDSSYTGLFFLFLLVYLLIAIILIINKKKYFKIAQKLIMAAILIEIVALFSGLMYFYQSFGISFTIYDAYPILLGFAMLMLSRDLK